MPRHRHTLGAVQVPGQLTARPVRQPGFHRRRSPGQRQHPRRDPRRHLLARRGVAGILQTSLPVRRIPVDPTVHRRQGHPGQHRNILTTAAFGHPQHDPSPGRHHRRHVPAVDHRPQLPDLGLGQHHTRINDPPDITHPASRDTSRHLRLVLGLRPVLAEELLSCLVEEPFALVGCKFRLPALELSDRFGEVVRVDRASSDGA
jgi:hypothetical protein